jgi:hypothetical protein
MDSSDRSKWIQPGGDSLLTHQNILFTPTTHRLTIKTPAAPAAQPPLGATTPTALHEQRQQHPQQPQGAKAGFGSGRRKGTGGGSKAQPVPQLREQGGYAAQPMAVSGASGSSECSPATTDSTVGTALSSSGAGSSGRSGNGGSFSRWQFEQDTVVAGFPAEGSGYTEGGSLGEEEVGGRMGGWLGWCGMGGVGRYL